MCSFSAPGDKPQIYHMADEKCCLKSVIATACYSLKIISVLLLRLRMLDLP